MASGPITSWEIDGGQTLFLGAPKSPKMAVTTAVKLKDTCSLEEKL